MENAAEALKMAGWVLIFIVALSICINFFFLLLLFISNIITYIIFNYVIY